MSNISSSIESVNDTYLQYHTKENYISCHELKLFLKSPKAFYYNKYTKLFVQSPRHISTIDVLQKLFACNFDDFYLVAPDIDRRTKEGKESFDKCVELAGDRIILFKDEIDIILEIYACILNNDKILRKSIESITAEHNKSYYFTDLKSGIKIKLRPDLLCVELSSVIDFKYLVNVSLEEIDLDITQQGYDISNAIYYDYLNVKNYTFIAVEKKPPYQSFPIMLGEEKIAAGRDKYRRALDLLSWSIKNNFWCDVAQFEMLNQHYDNQDLETFKEVIYPTIKF